MSRGLRRHFVTLTGPGTSAPNADGEFVPTTAPLDPPTWWCAIAPATVRDLERSTAGTVVTTATFIVEGDYHAGITTQTQITTDDGRVFYVAGVQDPDLRHVTTICFCSEQAR